VFLALVVARAERLDRARVDGIAAAVVIVGERAADRRLYEIILADRDL